MSATSFVESTFASLQKAGLEGKLSGPGIDIDVALCEFRDYFHASQNIKFSFPFKPALEFELLNILDQLENQSWSGVYHKHEVPNANNLWSGFVYGKKKTEEGLAEYGAAGFIRFNGKGDIVVEGTLYGQDREELGKVYKTMLNLFADKFGKAKRLKPVKEYCWQKYLK